MTMMPTGPAPRTASDSDEELLRRYFVAQAPDTDAMEQLFKRHADTAFRIAMREMRNSADAEEAVQSAFLNVLTKGRNQSVANVRGWIMGIVVNSCRDKIKEDARRRKRVESAATDRTAEQTRSDEKTELIAAAMRTVEALPERYRLAVSMHFLEGMTFREVACALSLSEDAVAQQASRGIEQVRQSLAAAGFTASAIAIPELLVSSGSVTAPAALTASFKTMIANAGATKAISASAAAKSAGVQMFLKAALLLTALLVVTIGFQRGSGPSNPRADGAAPAASQPEPLAGSQPVAIDNGLAAIFNKKISVSYRNEILGDVLEDLNLRYGLHSLRDYFLHDAGPINLALNDITLKDALERIAVATNLKIEFRNSTAVFWNKPDEKILADLEQKLKEGDESKRAEAVASLAFIADVRVYPLLYAAMKDPSEEVRFWASSGLTQHRDTFGLWSGAGDTVEELRRMVDAPPAGIEKWIPIAMLGATQDARAVKPLLELIQGDKIDDWRLASLVAGCLGQIESEDSTLALRGLLKDPHKATRAGALMALGARKIAYSFDEVAAFLNDPYDSWSLMHPGDDRRQYAARMLAIFMRDQDAASVIALSRQGKAETRGEAALLLGYLVGQGNAPAYDELVKLLDDPLPAMRGDACYAAGLSRDVRFVEALINHAEHDSDLNVRARAAFSLGWIGTEQCVGYLLKKAQNPADDLQGELHLYLSVSHDERAIDACVPYLRDANMERRTSAFSALAEIHTARACNTLLALTKDKDDAVRKDAIVRLAAYPFSRPEVVDDLLAMLQTGNDAEKASAAEGLQGYYWRPLPGARKVQIRSAIKEYERLKKTGKPAPAGDF